jgi:hypothetical protein
MQVYEPKHGLYEQLGEAMTVFGQNLQCQVWKSIHRSIWRLWPYIPGLVTRFSRWNAGQSSQVKLKDRWCNVQVGADTRKASGQDFAHMFAAHREDGNLSGTPKMEPSKDRPTVLMVRKKHKEHLDVTMADTYQEQKRILGPYGAER